MKIIQNIFRKIKVILIVSLLTIISTGAFAQDPPPPPGEDGGGNPANSDNQLGGAAHVGGGLLILFSLAIAYGGRQLYLLQVQKKEDLLN
jgi:hypothetical protein